MPLTVLNNPTQKMSAEQIDALRFFLSASEEVEIVTVDRYSQAAIFNVYYFPTIDIPDSVYVTTSGKCGTWDSDTMTINWH